MLKEIRVLTVSRRYMSAACARSSPSPSNNHNVLFIRPSSVSAGCIAPGSNPGGHACPPALLRSSRAAAYSRYIHTVVAGDGGDAAAYPARSLAPPPQRIRLKKPVTVAANLLLCGLAASLLLSACGGS